ncbi:unnamed protein product [Ostreobium quekettii]|uniref:Cell cycle checkpoint protein RAD17 n=1 Tax=Ostreobium quekettii TaxID=121088 RepID=A0A8S1J241_9CHLO|nr:unnamed protein product [Ostreobium quekettii]|eukprot:evm.model.scf_122.4 EVM.evm.TU.scf_122.4   scf_122:10188-14963(+)
MGKRSRTSQQEVIDLLDSPCTRSQDPARDSQSHKSVRWGSLVLSPSRSSASQQQFGEENLCFSQTQGSRAWTSKGAASPPRTPPGRSGKDQWAEVHAPTCVAELAVQAKKVDEVKDWLLRHAPGSAAAQGPRMVLLSGLPGTCKSTAIRLLAKECGYQLTEWMAPVPTLWSERQHGGPHGLQYVSKLDSFAEFVSCSKFPMLPLHVSAATEGSTSAATGKDNPKLLLVDDLPHPHSAAARAKLMTSLEQLATSARFPTVCVLTESPGSHHRGDHEGGNGSLPNKDVLEALQRLGVPHIHFNPVTQPNAVKAMERILDIEGMTVEKQVLRHILAGAKGDLKNAVHTLQVAVTGLKPDYGGRRKAKRKKGCQMGVLHMEVDRLASIQRDAQLSVFHALGKILYNKRENDKGGSALCARTCLQLPSSSQAQDQVCSLKSVQLLDRYMRPPSKYNPEEVVGLSGLDASSLVGFLHEHHLHFCHSDAMDTAADAAEYFSDADVLAGWDATRSRSTVQSDDGANIAVPLQHLAAESIAARGIMFANSSPAPPRHLYHFHGPLSSTVEQTRQANLQELNRAVMRLQSAGCRLADDASIYSVDCLPLLRQLNVSGGKRVAVLPRRLSYIHQGTVENWQNSELEIGVDDARNALRDVRLSGSGSIVEEDVIEDYDD